MAIPLRPRGKGTVPNSTRVMRDCWPLLAAARRKAPSTKHKHELNLKLNQHSHETRELSFFLPETWAGACPVVREDVVALAAAFCCVGLMEGLVRHQHQGAVESWNILVTSCRADPGAFEV